MFGYWNARISQHDSKDIEKRIKACEEEWNAIYLKTIRSSILRLYKIINWVFENNGEFYHGE